MDGSIGGLFLLVKGYLALKSRGWRCDWEREVGRRPSFREIGFTFWVESPVKKAFLSTIQADLSCTPFFHNAL
jgi:hypothetical protein